MIIDHIGYAVKKIELSIDIFLLLGYRASGEVIHDTQRGVNILFMENKEHRIELIEPQTESSPVNNILKKNGPIPYHICYKCNDIESTVDYLKKKGAVLIEAPNSAVAFSNKMVAFLYFKDIGTIELVEGE